MRLYSIFACALIALIVTQASFAQRSNRDSSLTITVVDGKFVVKGVLDSAATKSTLLLMIRASLSKDIPDSSVEVDRLARSFREGWDEVLSRDLSKIKNWRSGIYTLSVDKKTESLHFVEHLMTTEVTRFDTNAREPLIDPQKRVTLIFLVATWCGPCIAPIPHLRKLHVEYGSRGLDIIAVDSDTDDTPKILSRFALTHDIRFRLRIADQAFAKRSIVYSDFAGILQFFIIADKKVEYLGRGYAKGVQEEIYSTISRLLPD